MARPREFDKDFALDAAIGVFREHGFEGTSAEMLVRAMKIGRQSVYDTFGDKWQLYCAAVSRYAATEVHNHMAALKAEPRAIDGLKAMIERAITNAQLACLGIGSVCEFGRTRPDLSDIHDAADRALRAAIAALARQAQIEGDVAADVDPDVVAGFLAANIAAIRIAARGGADASQLQALACMALRALR